MLPRKVPPSGCVAGGWWTGLKMQPSGTLQKGFVYISPACSPRSQGSKLGKQETGVSGNKADGPLAGPCLWKLLPSFSLYPKPKKEANKRRRAEPSREIWRPAKAWGHHLSPALVRKASPTLGVRVPNTSLGSRVKYWMILVVCNQRILMDTQFYSHF